MQNNNRFIRYLQHPLLPIILAPMVLLSPVLFTGKALFWGTPLTQFVPWWQWAFDTLLSGHLPLWNPLVGMGAPLIGNYQSALFYPPNWIYFLSYSIGGITFLAWSQALMLSVHLIWSAIGMSFLSRRLGLGKLSQIVSGLAFSLSGYLVARAWFASVNTAVAWLPWILIYAYDLVNSQEKGIQIIKLGGILGLQLLAGHAQTTWYTWLLTGLWISFWWWQSERNNGHKVGVKILSIIKAYGRFGISIMIAGSLAAVQLLPTAAYLFQSQRASATEFEAAMTYSFWPWRFLGMVAPNLFGNPVQANYWGYGNFWEDAVYIGLLPFLLSIGVIWKTLLTAVKKGRSEKENQHSGYFHPKALVYFLMGVIFLSVLLALGDNTLIFPWLYHNVPTFDMFQSPTRFSIWWVFALCLLAGIGIEKWQRPTGRGLYWTRLGTAGAFAVTLSAGIGGYYLKDVATDFKPTFVPAIAFAGFWGLGVGILSLTAPQEDRGQHQNILWFLGVILWVSLDLLVAGWGLNPGIELDFYQTSVENREEVREMLGDGRLYLLSQDEHSIKYDRYFHFESFIPEMSWENLRGMVLPNMNLLEGIPVVNNYDPLVPTRYAHWMKGIDEVNIHQRDDLLDLMDISTMEWSSPSGNFGVRFIPVADSNRVRWVPCARFVENRDQAWDLIYSGETDFTREVVLEGQGFSTQTTCVSEVSRLEIVSEHPNDLIIHSSASDPGWIVLSDTWYAGWRAWMDGESVPILHANYLFRAVQVPAGSHLVQFAYRPPWFYLGVILSFLTLLGIGGFFLKLRVKSF